MEARDHIIEQIKEAARRSESKPFPSMDKVWGSIEQKLDNGTKQEEAEAPFPGMTRVWDKIEERLDEEKQQSRRVIPFRSISIAAAVLLIICLGLIYFSPTVITEKNTTETYAKQNTESVKPVPVDGYHVPGIQSESNISLSAVASAQKKVFPRKRKTIPFVAPVIKPDEIYTQEGPVDDHDAYFSRTLKGRVLNENGEGLAGAVVQAKGAKIGAITDVDGYYEIEVNGNLKELQVKGIGMTSKMVAINKGGNIQSVILETDPEMTAEISIYGRSSDKKSYVGSVADLNSPKMINRLETNIDQAIAGQLPGVKISRTSGQFGYSSDLLLMGLNAAGSANSPAVVIDGTFYSGTSVALKPGEVESLTVLKDESAIAAYGSKGSNGVIVIKTKNGKGYTEPKPGFMKKVKSIFSKKNK